METLENIVAVVARAQELAGPDVAVTAVTRLYDLNLIEEDIWELAWAIGHDVDDLDEVLPDCDRTETRVFSSLAFLSAVSPAARRLLDDQPEIDEPTLDSLVASLEAGHHVPSGQTSRRWQAGTVAGGLNSVLTGVVFLFVLPWAAQLIPCESACSDCSAQENTWAWIRALAAGYFAWLAVTTCLPGLLAIRRDRAAKSVRASG